MVEFSWLRASLSPTCCEEENCDHIVLYFNSFTLANVSGVTKWTICLVVDIYLLP